MLKKTTKILLTITVLIFMIFCNSQYTYASDINGNSDTSEKKDDEQEQVQELIDESQAGNLYDELPQESKDFLKNNGIEQVNAQQLIDMDFFTFIKSIFTNFKKTMNKPLVILFKCIAIILICSLMNALKNKENSYEEMFSVMSILCMCEAIIMPIVQTIIQTKDVIKTSSNFMMTFIPIYAGTVTATGKPISALSYQTTLLVVVQVISKIAGTILVPLLGIYLAFCLIGAMSDKINIQGIASGVQKTVTISLSFLLTIFVGVMTINSNMGSACDNIGVRSAKFALSTFLPVVGTSVSEAFSTVQGCLNVVKTSVGSFSIIAVASIFLPNIISLLAIQLVTKISIGISQTLETKKIAIFLKCASNVLSLCLSLVVMFFILIIVSAGIMLKI